MTERQSDFSKRLTSFAVAFIILQIHPRDAPEDEPQTMRNRQEDFILMSPLSHLFSVHICYEGRITVKA